MPIPAIAAIGARLAPVLARGAGFVKSPVGKATIAGGAAGALTDGRNASMEQGRADGANWFPRSL